jgi:uncharacterized protein (DUF885 family)
MRLYLILAPLALAASTAHAQPAAMPQPDSLSRILADHWKWWLSEHPAQATALGVRDYDTQLDDLSLAGRDARTKAEEGFLGRLNALPDAGLSADDRVNRDVLKWMLEEHVEANRHGEKAMLFTTYYGWHQTFADLPDSVPFYNRADYESYLARLTAYPKQNGEALEVTRWALKQGYVQPCSVLTNYGASIAATVAGPPEKTRFYAPFLRPRPRDISEADWTAMQGRAVALIRDVVAPEYQRFSDLFFKDYLPHCRKTDGAAAMPGGKAWYATQVKAFTTTSLTPEQIHQIGLDEVKRIGARMDALAKEAGYPDRSAFVAKLRADPAYFAKSPEEMLEAAARQAKIIDGLMPRYFGQLPRLPYGLKPIPAATAETTATAYYAPGSPESGIAGFFHVNTSKLDQRPLWELPALTAHEAVPGHHNQIALQQEMALPEFRRVAADFTAYVEGWGLYSEYLGEEMGLYDTPEKMMGRLSYEMWRACRLVLDTGIHAKGWDKAKAVAFMTANTGLSAANIDAEVNRYISWPGQALGYKIGEIRIGELRGEAEKALGDKFDLRRFHDAVLSQGPVPLDVLSERIRAWIAAGGK